MTERLPPRMRVLVSDSATPCGVEAFARRLAATAGDRARTQVLGAGAGMPSPDEALVINLPVVAWKRRLAEPVAAAAAARAGGRQVIIVLHEWADLDWKRRASYAPLLPLATALLFSAPEVMRQFGASPLARLATGRRGLVPIPPNLERPAATVATPHSHALAAERARGRLVIGHFGSIYPKKQSALVLDVAAALLARGEDPFLAFVGSFVKGQDRVEEEFRARVAALGLADRVRVTGYVASDAEVFGILEEAEVFVYSFAEGLTARRGSVLACAMAARPVVVNAPAGQGAFDHHPTYRRLIEAGALRLVPHDASPDVLAEAVTAARGAGQAEAPLDAAAAWDDALWAVEAALVEPR